MFYQKLSAVAAAAVVAFGVGGVAERAEAATCPAPVTLGVSSAVDCDDTRATGPGGNIFLADMNAGAGAFGKTWTFESKIDDNQTSPFFTVDALDQTSGTWSLTFPWTFHPGGHYALALKGGPDALVYLLDNSVTSGNWTMAGITVPGPSGNLADLSNITLFGTEDLKPIPLPAAAWLLLSGMAGLGVMGARKRKAQAA